MSRWRPGQSGNPNGRLAGTGEVAKLRAGIAASLPDILEKLTEAAKAGDVQAARLLLERVLPPIKAIQLPAPVEMPNLGTLADQARAILGAATRGDLAVDDAAALIGALAAAGKVIETSELLARVEALEAAKKEAKR